MAILNCDLQTFREFKVMGTFGRLGMKTQSAIFEFEISFGDDARIERLDAEQ